MNFVETKTTHSPRIGFLLTADFKRYPSEKPRDFVARKHIARLDTQHGIVYDINGRVLSA